MTTVGDRLSTTSLRPRYGSANIRTWIGFKQFMSLAEEAVLGRFRELGLGPQRLFHSYGLGLSIVDSSVQLPAVLEIDDEVTVGVATDPDPARFTVRLATAHGGVLRGRLSVALVRERDAPAAEPAPTEIQPLVVDGLGVGGPRAADLPAGFHRTWRIPYYDCHFSNRMQHGGYVRALEDVVERFLADRGMSVRTMLDTRGWIPVVSRARVRLLADAYMEETMHAVFRVTEVFKESGFDGRMDCYVARGGTHVHVATASILHGYAASRGPAPGSLARLDSAAVEALAGLAGEVPR